jgi:hypothetical protein
MKLYLLLVNLLLLWESIHCSDSKLQDLLRKDSVNFQQLRDTIQQTPLPTISFGTKRDRVQSFAMMLEQAYPIEGMKRHDAIEIMEIVVNIIVTRLQYNLLST